MSLDPGRVMMVSLGCSKNLIDSEEVLGGLIEAGWQVIDQAEAADLIIVNTCAFIQPAVEEALEAILEAAAVKARRPVRLVVMGCLVQRYGRKLGRNIPEVDLWLGPGEFARLPDLLAKGSDQNLVLGRPAYLRHSGAPRSLSTGPGWAYLKIAEGCSHACTFCLIPKLRGKYRSRTIDDLTAEAGQLLWAGVKELVLVAQDTSRFGRDIGQGLIGLIQELDRLPDLHWVRLLYLHPDEVDQGLVEAVAESRTVIPYFDLPVQHAAPRILKDMGRQRGPDELLKLIEAIRQKIPGAVIRTTMMVGFPGETDREFRELIDFMGAVRFDHLGVFCFSPEAGTPAARNKDQVPTQEAEARQGEVMARQAEISRQKLAPWVGQEVAVLVEGPHPESELLLAGRTWFLAPEVDGKVIITDGSARAGDLVRVRVTRGHDFDLEGEIIASSEG
ncbi:MAG: 30S ribosomal protein S12 methylthiotransferase RimO [Proteobacteria bacterium]|nr:30S ribosomal protein S12 methylthiotransferase RimO [Pseudomonadota bacterium]